MKTTVPAELRPQDVVALIDSREQLPLNLSPLAAEPATLQTGDYSVRGLQHVIALERKSLSDALGCIGQDRERFEREIMRLLAYPVRALVIEATWPEIEAGQWRSKVTPAAAIGSLLGWTAKGIPVIMAGDHERAGRFVSRILYIAARRYWRDLRAFAETVSGPDAIAASDVPGVTVPKGDEDRTAADGEQGPQARTAAPADTAGSIGAGSRPRYHTTASSEEAR